MTTTFVEMYHPALPGTPHVRAASQAVAEYAARGWIVVDGSTPVPSSQFLTPFAGDLRYLKVWTPNEVLTAGAVRVAPDGHVITRTGNGTARGSYDTTEQAAWTVVGGGGSSGQPLQQIAATVSASGALVSNKHNPVNATGGAKVMTLPTGQAEGTTISAEKTDASTNAVTVTGNIRGVGSTTITLLWQNEDLVFRADSAGSWWPISGHKTKTSLDSNYGPYGLSVGRANCVVPVGSHSDMFGNFTVTTDGPAVSYRSFYPLADPTCTTVLPVFHNQPNLVQAGDYAPPNAITISAACELSDGTVVPFYFNGSRTVTLTGGSVAIPDAPVQFGAQVTDTAAWLSGTSGVVIRTFVQVAASRTDTATVTSGSATVADTAILASDQGRLVTGTGIPLNTFVGTVTPSTSFLLSTRPDSQVNVNATVGGTSVVIQSVIPLNASSGAIGNVKVTTGTDLTTDAAAAGKTGFGGSNANGYGPSLLLAPATKTRKPIVASLTDSIFFGSSDQSMGPVSRACAQYGFGHVKLSKVGETVASYATAGKWKYRRTLLTGCTHAVIELGTNDGIDTTGKATTLQTNLTTLLTYLNSLGIKSIVTTVPPKGNSSTDGYATTAGQSANSNAAASSQINTWIRGLVGTNGVVGIVDMNAIVSSATDSGLWAQAPGARHLTDLGTTSGSNVVTSAAANFTSADVGLGIYVTGVYTNYLAVIGSVTNSTTVTVNNIANPANPVPTAFNAGSTVTNAVGGVGAWYATQDGTHPSYAMMSGGILTAVQSAMAGLSV